MKYQKFISVDLQKDFTDPDGKAYKPRPCVDFIKNTLIPYFKDNDLKIAEIISDYKQPRPGDSGDCCWPGSKGFESIIPDSIKKMPVWVKSMNSPIWIRQNNGVPYQDGNAFQNWLDKNVGPMNTKTDVVLFGLTSDCCVLSTAQELKWRGYKVYILKDAVDNYSGDQIEKTMVLNNPPLTNWAQIVSWNDIVN